jgi:hypothetical protein
MTDEQIPTTTTDAAAAAAEPLPGFVHVTPAFAARVPSQRVLDLLTGIEGVDVGPLLAHSPGRIIAFRALLRDFPERDPTSLWLHAYDVETELDEPNPTNGSGPTPWRGSAVSGA